jgi:redox-sensitive bicupin YhaK (pirin superfamily)
MFYADAVLETGAELTLPDDYEERAIHVAEGGITLAGDSFGAGQLLVCRPGEQIGVKAPGRARVLLLGGDPLDGPRHVWWNFVSSSRERIEQAKRDWKEGRFPKVPGDDAEFIPLPE